MPILQKKKTRKYRGAWDHLDEWESVALYENVMYGGIKEEGNLEQSQSQEMLIRVYDIDPTATEGDILQAIRDEFTYSHCQHDYDCCGCRSYHTHEVIPLSKGYYLITQTSSRNY